MRGGLEVIKLKIWRCLGTMTAHTAVEPFSGGNLKKPLGETERTRGFRFAMLFSAALLLVGCTNLRLHSQGTEDQGKAAQQAWAAVDWDADIDARRKIALDALKRESDHARAATVLSMNIKMRTLATATATPSEPAPLEKRLKTPVEEELKRLGGSGAQRAALNAAHARQDAFVLTFKKASFDFKKQGLELPPGCSKLAEVERDLSKWATIPDNLVELRANLPAVKSGCAAGDPTAVLDLVNQAVQPPDTVPALWANLKTLSAAEKSAADKTAKHAGDRNEYRAAAEQYNRLVDQDIENPDGTKVVAAAAAPSAPASAASSASNSTEEAKKPPTPLEAAIARLKKAVATLSEADDKLSLGLISAERISAANELLSALETPKAAGAEGETRKDQVGRALKRLEATNSSWKDVKAEAADTLKRPLLALEELERANLALVQQSVAADVAAVEVRRQRAQVLQRQVNSLTDASGSLSQITVLPTSMGAVVDSDEAATTSLKRKLASGAPASEVDAARAAARASKDARYRVLDAAAAYAYKIGPLEGELEALKLKDYYIQQTRSFNEAAANMAQRKALISANVDLLAAWSKTGVKPETISRLINYVLLIWIGVNTQ